MKVDYTQIIEKYKSKSTKIDFNVKKLNISEISNIYKIKGDEAVIAYLKGPIPFTSISFDGIILSSEAFYVHPSRIDKDECNRYPYNELCNSFIIFSGGTSALRLIGTSSYKTLIGITLIGNNTRGKELYDILISLQEVSYNNDVSFKIQFDKFRNSFVEKCKAKIRVDNLDEQEIQALIQLHKLSNWEKTSATILIQNALRICDKKLFDEMILTCSCEEISEMFVKSTYEGLIHDFENPYHKFEKQFLEKIEINVEKQENKELLGHYLYKVQAYVFLKLEKYEKLEEVYQEIINQKNACIEFREFILCKNILLNKKMQNVLDAIKNEKIPSEDLFNLKDSLNFTLLHYAIFLENNTIIKQILEKIKPQHIGICNTGNMEFDALHKPDVLAAYLGVDDADYIFIKTSFEAINFTNTIESLKKNFQLQQKRLSINEKIVSSFQDEIRKQEKLHHSSNVMHIRQRLSNVLEKRKQILLKMNQIRIRMESIQQELVDLIQKTQIQRSEIINAIRKSQDSLVINVLHMISKIDLYEKFLTSSTDVFKLVAFGKTILCVPKTWNIVFERYDEDEIYKTEYPQKLYGDSWFSEEAHRDLRTLKSEYRSLAKKYHPDHYKEPRAKEIFQEILEERMKILENI